MYHRIGPESTDPWSLNVQPEHLVEHLEILRRDYRVVQLRQLLGELRTGALQPHTVAVTFDDGYANNLHAAAPLLESAEVPATVFVTSGFLAMKQECWWDILEQLLLHPGSLPPTLDLILTNNSFHYELNDAQEYSEAEARRFRHWRAWEKAPTPRHALYRSLYTILHTSASAERNTLLDILVEWADAEPICRPSHRMLAAEELQFLARKSTVDIGAHTVTHQSLAKIPIEDQLYEVSESRKYLEELLNTPIDSFSYPHGGEQDISATASALVRECGFIGACSTSLGALQADSDPFLLPRVHVEDWNGKVFARQLATI